MAQRKLNQRSRLCGTVAYVESGALFLYCVLLSITAVNSSGATVSAPVVEIAIFLIFAVGIFMVARGMWGRSINARAPYFLTQVFVLIVAYTVFAGDGSVVKVVGALIGIVGVVGLALGVWLIATDADDDPAPVEPALDGDEEPEPDS